MVGEPDSPGLPSASEALGGAVGTGRGVSGGPDRANGWVYWSGGEFESTRSTTSARKSNSLEEVEAGLEHSAENVYSECLDRRRDEWQTRILPALKEARLSDLVEQCHGILSRRALIDIRAGRSRPHRKNQALLVSIVNRWGSKPSQ
jgi:hypothetical protein